MDPFLQAAIDEAKKGLAAGGIPIGSVLVIDNKIVARGHNQRVQKKSPTLHAEMDCLENAGRLKPSDYRRATLYSTLSPCDMCSGTALLYNIPRIVVGLVVFAAALPWILDEVHAFGEAIFATVATI